MATHTPRAESALHNLPNQIPPMPAVARILSRFDRDQLHGFIAVAIDLADAMDGDADSELAGDEADSSWSEFHTRGSRKQVLGSFEMAPGFAHEDDEEDDPAGVHDEDGINTLSQGLQRSSEHGPGCEISDPGGCEHDGREHEDYAP